LGFLPQHLVCWAESPTYILSKDLKIISIDKYAELIKIFDGISKQAYGWQKINNN